MQTLWVSGPWMGGERETSSGRSDSQISPRKGPPFSPLWKEPLKSKHWEPRTVHPCSRSFGQEKGPHTWWWWLGGWGWHLWAHCHTRFRNWGPLLAISQHWEGVPSKFTQPVGDWVEPEFWAFSVMPPSPNISAGFCRPRLLLLSLLAKIKCRPP